MAIGATEVKLLTVWLTIITLFELSEIYKYLFQDANLDGFFSTLANERPEKRLWCMVLAFLMMSRIQAILFMNSPGVLIHNASVHILEAVVFGYEKFFHGGNEPIGTFFVVLLNAAWFTSAATRIDSA